ncbi:MAG TPA: hypothetical protein VFZ59_20320 [Verrucomicrobiae bacterium]|nr:hypothetical protein [Verrucomicrobiae bacterium]
MNHDEGFQTLREALYLWVLTKAFWFACAILISTILIAGSWPNRTVAHSDVVSAGLLEVRGLAFVPVPEPSVAVFAIVGVSAILLRHRIKSLPV